MPRTEVRSWRVRNNEAGRIQYCPPYEYRGTDVVYPVADFRRWCVEVKVEGGILHSNLPTPLPPCPLGDPLATAPADADDDIIAELLAAQAG